MIDEAEMFKAACPLKQCRLTNCL